MSPIAPDMDRGSRGSGGHSARESDNPAQVSFHVLALNNLKYLQDDHSDGYTVNGLGRILYVHPAAATVGTPQPGNY